MRLATAPRLSAFPVSMFIAGISVALVMVGAVSPWARVPGYKAIYDRPGAAADVFWVRGTEAPGMIPLVGDGLVILVLAALAAVMVLWRLLRPPKSSGFILLALFILLLLAALVGVVNWANAGNIPRADSRAFFSGSVEVSWGLILLCLSIWPGVLATAYQLWTDELK